MNKYINKLLLAFTVLITTSCVSAETAESFSKRAFPLCTNHTVVNHHYGTFTENHSGSLTEIKMLCCNNQSIDCQKNPKVISVQCVFGWGIFSDTTCRNRQNI